MGPELDDLRSGKDLGRRARRHVVGIASLEDLVAVGEVVGDLPLYHVPPVHRLTSVVWEAGEEGR